MMHTMSRDVTFTPAHETTCASTALDPGLTGRLVHHRGVEIILTTCAFHYRHVQRHAKKEAATVAATTTVRAINTMTAAIEDRKSYSNEDHLKATAVTSAKPHVISRLPGGNRLLAAAYLPRKF